MYSKVAMVTYLSSVVYEFNITSHGTKTIYFREFFLYDNWPTLNSTTAA